ncbi:MAG: DUF3413 domain-containing protein [Aeromonas sp.]
MVETGNPYRDNVSRLITWGHWFAFFNILMAMLVATRYVGAIAWPGTWLGVAYLGISWIGHFAFLSFVTYLITLFPLTFVLPKERPLRFVAVIIATLAQALLLVDTQVFSLFKFHLNAKVWQLLLDQAQTEEGGVWSLLFVALPSLFLLELMLAAFVWRKINKRKRHQYGNKVGLGLLACFVLTHAINSWADAIYYQPITMQRANFPLSYPMTAKSFLAKHGWIDVAEHAEQAKSQPLDEASRLIYPLRSLQVTAPSAPKNLLVVVVDGLRFDMLNNINMPNLQRYADQHLNFTQHLSGSNEAHASMFSLFYGLPSHYFPAIQAAERPPLLFDEMLRQDYQFGLFGASAEMASYRQSLLAGLRNQVVVSQSENDGERLAHWQAWLAARQGPRPWFALVQLNSPGSYFLPAGVSGPFLPDAASLNPAKPSDKAQLTKVHNRYKNAVFYVDQLLAEVTAELSRRGQQDNTVVVITANHGQEFNDNGRQQWGSGSNFSPYQVQVPLVIGWPQREAARLSQLTSHVDLAPTLLKELLGVRNPARDYASGRSLFDQAQRPWRLVGGGQSFAIYQGQTITAFDRQGEFELRDRASYKRLKHAAPEMGVMIEVMNELNRFYRQP